MKVSNDGSLSTYTVVSLLSLIWRKSPTVCCQWTIWSECEELQAPRSLLPGVRRYWVLTLCISLETHSLTIHLESVFFLDTCWEFSVTHHADSEDYKTFGEPEKKKTNLYLLFIIIFIIHSLPIMVSKNMEFPFPNIELNGLLYIYIYYLGLIFKSKTLFFIIRSTNLLSVTLPKS